ncbi:MAG: NAD(P)-binding domain-containing protein [Microbacteriaceae bacterium]|nr:NAD(P)-binding domain-containing protein [Microbacteriaceae bacterium]
MVLQTTVVIVGAGHSGLAMSRRLAERGIDHVVLERGEVANSWRTERWDSLRLLTPNWQSGLPAFGYAGDDPDGYMSSHQVADHLASYSRAIDAPVRTGVTVTSVAARDGGSAAGGYRVTTDDEIWDTDVVVLANGGSGIANLPPVADGVPSGVLSIAAKDYRSPDALPDGHVLVVGASASGVQLADELSRAGRDVTIAAGEHVRMPRRYRGRDVFWWMDAAGVLDERFDEIDDIVRARHVPSPQLVGSPDRTVDIAALRARGVRVAGRVGRIHDGVAQFSGGLANTVRLADLKLHRLLDRFDEWAARTGAEGLADPERPADTQVDAAPVLQLDLARERVGAIVWATGYRPDYSWLDVPVLDYKGRLPHTGGVVDKAPGLYVLGTTLLRRRRSSYIAGAAQDTADLAEHLSGYLAGRPAGDSERAQQDAEAIA